MGYFRLLFVAAFAAVVITPGCSSVPYHQAYPAIYAAETDEDRQSTYWLELSKQVGHDLEFSAGSVPEELVAALPEDFQAASLAGYLTCVTDIRGRLRFSPWLGLSKSDDSAAFKDLTDALDGTGMLRFSPPGYMGTACYRPDMEVGDMFGAQWLVDWARYLSAWQELQLDIAARRDLITKLSVEVAKAEADLVALNQDIGRLDAAITAKQQQLSDMKRRVSGTTKLLLAAQAGESSPIREPKIPFDITIPYDKHKDPWYPVTKELLVDFTDRLEYNKSQVNNERMAPEMIEALKVMSDAVKDPSNLPADVKAALKESGLTKVVVNSGARTPWHQVYAIKQAQAKGEPAAKFFNSNHQGGACADIQVDYKYDTSQHKALRKFARHFGLKFPVPGDRYHVELVSPPHSMNSRTLAIIRANYKTAIKIRDQQEGEVANIILIQTDLEKSKEKLAAAAAVAVSKRNAKASIFERVSAEYIAVMREWQRQQAERESYDRHNQAIERAERAAERTRETRDRQVPREPREIRRKETHERPVIEGPGPVLIIKG